MIDPQIQVLLDDLAKKTAGSPPLPMLSPADIRRGDLRFSDLCLGDTPREPVGVITDHVIEGPGGPLRLRAYRPAGEGSSEQAGAVGGLMFFHGGGFMMGDLDTHDHICRALCNAASSVVVAVAYRLAPEHKYPAALDDCIAATRWVAAQHASLGFPADRLAVSGDSAGGTLAALVAQALRDTDGPALRLQALIYPETSGSLDWPSVTEFWEPGRMAAGKGMGFFRSKYFSSPAEWAHATAYPDNAVSLAGLPPALIITAEIDPMRDMAEAYAARLREAGVPTTLTRYDGVTHVFLSMFPRVDAGRRALNQAAAAVHAALAA